MYLVSVFMDNYCDGVIQFVKKAVKMCNEIFLCTYLSAVDCESMFFDIDDCRQQKSINEKGLELVDFWDAYKDYYDDCQDMKELPLVVATRKVVEIREKIS